MIRHATSVSQKYRDQCMSSLALCNATYVIDGLEAEDWQCTGAGSHRDSSSLPSVTSGLR